MRRDEDLSEIYPGYNVKLHLVVRFQFRRPGECGVLLHRHYSQVHSDPEW